MCHFVYRILERSYRISLLGRGSCHYQSGKIRRTRTAVSLLGSQHERCRRIAGSTNDMEFFKRHCSRWSGSCCHNIWSRVYHQSSRWKRVQWYWEFLCRRQWWHCHWADCHQDWNHAFVCGIFFCDRVHLGSIFRNPDAILL